MAFHDGVNVTVLNDCTTNDTLHSAVFRQARGSGLEETRSL
jgi:hypothetical protein